MTISLSPETKEYFLSEIVNKENNEDFVMRLFVDEDLTEPFDKSYAPSVIFGFEWEIGGQKMITALSDKQIFQFDGGIDQEVLGYFVETYITKKFLFKEDFTEPINIESGGSVTITLEMELK